MYNIAILGYGVVGSGVVEILEKNKRLIDKRALNDINIKYIFDKREFKGEPIEKLLTTNIDDILEDETIDIVLELMGGINPSYDFVKKALLKGKNVVTSNKELVATHGTELLQIAQDKNINFLFEASAGGGIPIIRSIKQALTADEINKIEGILNGTTNYILTKLTKDGSDYKSALKEAQDNGFAEKDPTNDVEGFDTVRKLAILLSLSSRRTADSNQIKTEGISHITREDILFAKEIKSTIKLIAYAEKNENVDKGFYAEVAPYILGEGHQLTNVHGVFNSVLLRGNVVDEIMIYGKGAGKLPTASAVIGDVVDISRHRGENIGYYWSSKPLSILPADELNKKYFIRILSDHMDKAKEEIKNIFNTDKFISIKEYPNNLVFITNPETKKTIDEKINKLSKIIKVVSKFKMED